jgi:hypothetical protein
MDEHGAALDAPQDTEEGEKTMIEIVKLMYEHPFITIALMLACSAMLSAFKPIVIVRRYDLKNEDKDNDT